MQQRVLLRAARHSAAASGSGCPAPAARPAAASRAGSRRAHVTPAGGARRVTRARATRRAGNSSYRRPRGGSSQRPHAALCARAAVAAAAVDANGSSGFTVSENIGNTSAVSLIQEQKTLRCTKPAASHSPWHTWIRSGAICALAVMVSTLKGTRHKAFSILVPCSQWKNSGPMQ